MPLISCPACDKQISDKAVSCPTCAHPMVPDAVRANNETAAPTPTTIEMTSKKYKGGQLLGVIGICVGLVAYIGVSPGAGSVVMLVSLLVYGASRIGGWWNNG